MITMDSGEIGRAERALRRVPGGAQKAVARALNRAVQSGKTAASKSARQTHLLQPKKLSEALTVKRADAGLVASLIARGKPRALTYYKVKPSHPLYAQVKKSGGGSIPDGFTATMKTRHNGVFVRRQEGSRGPIKKYLQSEKPRNKKRGGGMTKGRAAIKELFGPSVPGIMKNQSAIDAFSAQAEETFSNRLRHEVKALVKGYAK